MQRPVARRRAVSTFLALLAVLALVFDLAVVVTAVVAKVRGGLSPDDGLRARLGSASTPCGGGAAVATTSTLGSLYLSEVAKFPPCHLCWYQRIAMYPIVVILLVAAVRRDARVKWYVLPIVAIGVGISTYHYLIERFPDTVSSPRAPTRSRARRCGSGSSTSCRSPAWPGSASSLIATLVLLARPSGGRAPGSGHSGGAATVSEARDEEDAVP